MSSNSFLNLFLRRAFHYGIMSVMLIISFLLGGFFFIAHHTVIDFSALEHYNPGKASVVLDDEGNEWARFQADKREVIVLQKVPNHIIQAFIAAEDHAFFNHHGISWKGMIRSILINLYHGKKVQGASTITQQLVRLLFFDARKTFERKIKEQFFALLIEKQFSKEHILEVYLNHIYFGCGIYGIEAACQRFWHKSATEISLDQAATLAAIVKSPGQYCPLLYPLSAQQRRNVILHSMVTMKFISQRDYEQAVAVPIKLEQSHEELYALHAREYVRTLVEQKIGSNDLYTGGYTLQTTIHGSLQRQAYSALRQHIEYLRKTLLPTVDGAIITIDVHTGAIKAMIGGYDFATSQFNRAIHAKRQLGSVFKPLIYAAAIEWGLNFATVDIDEPMSFVQGSSVWEPNNYSMTFQGTMTLANALTRSNNIITIKTLIRIGYDRVIELAQLCRLSAILKPYPSLALGCVDGTLHEVVGMFNIFANNGRYVEPYILVWIKDEWGTKIWKNSAHEHHVLDPVVSGQVTKILGLSMDRARKKSTSEWLNCEAIGKTGTTNDSRTCWFLGSTPSYTTGIYIGCDDNRSLGSNVFGSTTGFPLWLAINKALPSEKKNFSYDPHLIPVVIHSKTGDLCLSNHPEAYTILVSNRAH